MRTPKATSLAVLLCAGLGLEPLAAHAQLTMVENPQAADHGSALDATVVPLAGGFSLGSDGALQPADDDAARFGGGGFGGGRPAPSNPPSRPEPAPQPRPQPSFPRPEPRPQPQPQPWRPQPQPQRPEPQPQRPQPQPQPWRPQPQRPQPQPQRPEPQPRRPEPSPRPWQPSGPGNQPGRNPGRPAPRQPDRRPPRLDGGKPDFRLPPKDDRGRRLPGRPIQDIGRDGGLAGKSLGNAAVVERLRGFARDAAFRDGKYHWASLNGVRCAYWYDAALDQEWFGFYLADQFFWSLYWNDYFWWYDAADGRWLWYWDGQWYWESPDGTLYVYEDGGYYRWDDDGVLVPAEPAPMQAEQSAEWDQAASRTEQAIRGGMDALSASGMAAGE